MPLQATSGAASYDAFGGGVPVVPNYIEEVFQTWLYTGNSSTQTITNGIDLSTKGGLVWQKTRPRSTNHFLTDSARGFDFQLATNSTDSQVTRTGVVTPTTSGFSLNGTGGNNINYVDESVVSWTFRKQPKFFDVQTFTYPSSGSITVSHNLASTPGCVMVKNTDGADGWYVYHRMANNGTNPSNYILQLNTTGAQINNFASWITVGSTSITFPSGALNPGSNFVMYLFAHDAGGFGLTGTDNVISCGSYVGAGTGASTTVNLGYEPQWVLVKPATTTGPWSLIDNMRGWTADSSGDRWIEANTSGAEYSSAMFDLNATGFATRDNFSSTNSIGQTYIYIAIRRGPMKVPTVGTSVFYPTTYTGTGTARTFSGFGFPPDFELSFSRGGIAAGDGNGSEIYDKLRGPRVRLLTPVTDAEFTTTESVTMLQDGISVGTTVNSYINASGYEKVLYGFRRAPSFFDEVCYTGDSTAGRTITHNLGVAPEFIIAKSRSNIANWRCYVAPLGNTNIVDLDSTGALASSPTTWNSTTPTASVFTVGTNSSVNTVGRTYVAYLFATCAGVSKVGSYTGTATTLQVNCGFTAGARFVLIKRTDSTGDWYVWDSARGIVSGNDPYLLLNSTAAEVTSTDYIDTYSAGFEISSSAPSAINASGGTFIFLAIA